MKLPLKSGKGVSNTRKAGLKKTNGQVSLGKALFGMSIMAIPLFFLPPLLTHWEASKNLQSSQEQQHDLSLQIYSNGVQRWVNEQINRAEVLAGDRQVIAALSADDAGVLERKNITLKSYFPDALKVRLLKPGTQREDLNATPPITFAAVEMIQSVESSARPTPMEVHGAGTSQQHINLVRPVMDSNGHNLSGILMVSFPMSKLQQLVTGVNVPGYTELNQLAGGNMLLSQQGDAGQKRSVADRTQKIQGSRWEVNYWRDTAQGAGGNSLVYGLASAIAAFFLLGGAFIQRSKLVKALVRDQKTILTVFEDIQGSRVKSEYPVALVEMREGMDQISDAGRMVAASMPVMAKSQGASQSAPEMDVVDVVESDSLFDSEGGEGRSEPPVNSVSEIDSNIFRAYDIRGIYGETLTEESAFLIGQSIGSEAYLRGEQTVIVGRDGRLSGEALCAALIKGLLASGRDVKDIGMVPTPVLYFAATTQGTGTGVMVTGSHNPANYNGFKVMLAGECLSGEAIKSLHQRIVTNDFLAGDGAIETVNILPEYIERIESDIQIARPIKVVVDCGNGVAGTAAPELFKGLGCDVSTLFCEVDGTFPNHHPDPGNPENLAALITAVRDQGAELGIAFDGDGDRLGVVTADGAVVWPDRLMMLFAADVLLRNPGAQVIYDVKSTRNLASVITENGGEPLMWQSGHSIIKAKMQQTGALLAGEMSGHIFFKERWFGFDDALYAAARLLEILSGDTRSVTEIFSSLPDSVNTPELTIPMAEGEPSTFMTQLSDTAEFENASIARLDGLRVETERGWGLVRASNTTPSLVMRFEADDELAMHSIQEIFRREMLQVKPDLALPF